jgi:hypothetical protein
LIRCNGLILRAERRVENANVGAGIGRRGRGESLMARHQSNSGSRQQKTRSPDECAPAGEKQ